MKVTDKDDQPFFSLRPLFSARPNDHEYVVKIAKTVRFLDRWRWLAVVFYASTMGVIVWLGFHVVDIVEKCQAMFFNQNPNVMPEGVVLIGLILGLNVGFLLNTSLMGFLNALSGFRTERLLVKYYQQSHADDPEDTEAVLESTK